MGVNSERQMEISWGIYNGTWLGDLEEYLVVNFEWV